MLSKLLRLVLYIQIPTWHSRENIKGGCEPALPLLPSRAVCSHSRMIPQTSFMVTEADCERPISATPAGFCHCHCTNICSCWIQLPGFVPADSLTISMLQCIGDSTKANYYVHSAYFLAPSDACIHMLSFAPVLINLWLRWLYFNITVHI